MHFYILQVNMFNACFSFFFFFSLMLRGVGN